ncbi:MAG: adenosylcobinamide amidohydrolase [Dehalococcoidia bacterium]
MMTRKGVSWQFEEAKAEVVYHQYQGVPIKTLLISFSQPRLVLSSREGFKRARVVCNNSNPPQLWDFVQLNWQLYLDSVIADLRLSPQEVACLSTGVDIDDLAIGEESFAEFRICVVVTAGVTSNALRIGVDEGRHLERDGKFEELGTINIIALTNASLSEGAMVRAIITATEAKIIALQDLDVRSSYSPQYQATGTGTDNVMIVSGAGEKIHYMGGHAKMGELLAKAVTAATREAILKHHREESG